jgi:hypothetical protein
MNHRQQFLLQLGKTVALVALLATLLAVAAPRSDAGTGCRPSMQARLNTSLIQVRGSQLRNASAQLNLVDLRAERIAGSYVSAHDPRVGLQFASSKADGKVMLWLADLEGHELVHMEGSQIAGVTLRHGDDLTLRMAPGVVQQQLSSTPRDGQSPARSEPMLPLDGQSATDSDVVVEGEPARLAEIDQRPELALLPALSRALGQRGMAGHELPATLPLHAYAMTFASRSPVPRFCTPDDPNCCNLTPDGSGCTSQEDSDEPSDCADEPLGSDCHGMCGPGCTCWYDVCGDCCYHPGCAAHDDACGACDWIHPVDCLKCYQPIIAAVIALGGC